jgi:5-methylcytosine-specific restriction endonuclease McrA
MAARRKKLVPIICEICGENNKAVLHKHHIIERIDRNTTNHELNLAIVCSNCHNKIHAKQIELIGLYPSTQLPYGRTLVYKKDGISNVPDINEPYYKPSIPLMRIHEKEKDNE